MPSYQMLGWERGVLRETKFTAPGVSESSSVHFYKQLSSTPSVLGTGDTALISWPQEPATRDSG